MDAEKLANFRNKAMNLSDSSTVAEFDALATSLAELYNAELPETLDASGVATEVGLVATDLASLVAEFDKDTSKVTK